MRSAQVKEEPAKRAGDTEQNTLPPKLPTDNARIVALTARTATGLALLDNTETRA